MSAVSETKFTRNVGLLLDLMTSDAVSQEKKGSKESQDPIVYLGNYKKALAITLKEGKAEMQKYHLNLFTPIINKLLEHEEELCVSDDWLTNLKSPINVVYINKKGSPLEKISINFTKLYLLLEDEYDKAEFISIMFTILQYTANTRSQIDTLETVSNHYKDLVDDDDDSNNNGGLEDALNQVETMFSNPAMIESLIGRFSGYLEKAQKSGITDILQAHQESENPLSPESVSETMTKARLLLAPSEKH